MLVILELVIFISSTNVFAIRASENSEICSGFGHNWAAEIRCLRETINSCIVNEDDDRTTRGMRSLSTRAETYGNGNHAATYSGYPNSKSYTPYYYPNSQFSQKYNYQKPKLVTTTAAPGPVVVNTCNCDMEQVSRNLTLKFEKRIYETKMGAQYECQLKIDKLKEKLETDLMEYQRMTDKDIRDITRKIEYISAKRATSKKFEYAFFDRFESWYTAEEYCIGWGGHLASIHSKEENSIVSAIIPDSIPAWISLNDVQKENIFMNTDKTKSDFRNWMEGQPDNEQHNENCVQIDSKGQWSDLLCLVTRPFVCKRKY